jgi:hypothetical protein
MALTVRNELRDLEPRLQSERSAARTELRGGGPGCSQSGWWLELSSVRSARLLADRTRPLQYGAIHTRVHQCTICAPVCYLPHATYAQSQYDPLSRATCHHAFVCGLRDKVRVTHACTDVLSVTN